MKPHPTTFYVLRHGESEHNRRKQMGIVPEARLTSKGIDQANLVSENFKNIKFDLVFSSDLIRAKQTTEIITIQRELPVNLSPQLRERSYGRLNGKTEAEIHLDLKECYETYKKMDDKQKYSHKLVEDMESTAETLKRVSNYLQELAKLYPGKVILIVSHSTVIRSLLIHLGFADYHEIDHSCIANTAYMILDVDGPSFFLRETFGITKRYV